MGEIPITFLFLFFFKNAPSPYEHVGHVAVLVTKHFAAFFFEPYSQFNRSWNANSFAPTSSEWCWFSGLSYIWNYVKSLRTFGRRCPHSCYANDPVDNSSLAGGREIREGERETEGKQGAKWGSLLMSPVCGMRDYCEYSLADRIKDQWPS